MPLIDVELRGASLSPRQDKASAHGTAITCRSKLPGTVDLSRGRGRLPALVFCIEVLPVGKNTHLIELRKIAHHVDDQELDEIDLRSPVVVVEDVVDVLVLFVSSDNRAIKARCVRMRSVGDGAGQIPPAPQE